MDVEDRNAIADLIAAYSFGWDTMDWDLYASIWTDDAVIVAGGRESLVSVPALRARREALESEGIQPRHNQTNTVFDSVTPDFIRARTLVLVARQHAGEQGPRLLSGYYRDEFRRTESGWRLARREIVIDQP
jgi:3-phenylpropionate/cinnamic acid dioxygenase small subunit